MLCREGTSKLPLYEQGCPELEGKWDLLLQEAKDSTNIHSQSYYAIMKAFGISGRNLTERETAFINKWTSSYSFSLDIIREACERTIRNTGKVNFEYADSILGSWSKRASASWMTSPA